VALLDHHPQFWLAIDPTESISLALKSLRIQYYPTQRESILFLYKLHDLAHPLLGAPLALQVFEQVLDGVLDMTQTAINMVVQILLKGKKVAERAGRGGECLGIVSSVLARKGGARFLPAQRGIVEEGFKIFLQQNNGKELKMILVNLWSYLNEMA
jgi:hypothetical protein